MLRRFIVPSLVAFVLLGIVFIVGGASAFFLASILVVLEVTLSFDNAVVNAKVLARMNEVWRRRFLTWGILIAVFGTRLVLPVLIVAASVFMAPWDVAILAVTDTESYKHLLEGSRVVISAFGAAFLMMVSLKYFFNHAKEIHWIEVIERRLSRWGRIEAVEIALALLSLVSITLLVPEFRGAILVAGIIGIVLFVVMEGVANSLDVSVASAAASGLTLFLYLNVLDSAFSLDGVIGAFALSTDLLVIAVGLGVGAYFVRSMTLYLVEARTLSRIVYLEHGAHYAILGLAVCMLLSIVVHVPELIIGCIGLLFVVLSYLSSRKEAKRVVTSL